MTTGARSNPSNVVVGFCIMMLGILLILDKLGLVNAAWVLQFWPAALILLGGALILQALRGGDAAHGGRFPVGAVIWLVLLGLFFTNVLERRSNAARGSADGVRLFGLMSGDERVSREAFHGGEMTSIMGGTTLDLSNARMAPGEEAVIDIFALMGGAIVYVPREWSVDVQTTAVMGGVKDERFERSRERRRPRRSDDGLPDPPDPPELPDLPDLSDSPEPPEQPSKQPSAPRAQEEPIEREDVDTAHPPKIVLRGFVMMGGVVIKSQE